MHVYIDSDAALAEWCATHDDGDAIALDTEFMRVRTYWPQLALLQLRRDGEIALIDPLAVRDFAPLAPWLAAPAPAKLMHSAGEDLIALAPVAGAPVGGLFDTQLAAALAGFGAGIGYQRLAQELLGVTLAKGETRSDWLARPLSAEQRRYAAADVEHLHALHAELCARLERLGRLAWCREDCERLARGAAPDPNPHWEFRGGWRWPLAVQVRARRLLLWRDATARAINRPRLWVFDNGCAAALAEHPPADLDGLAERLRGQRSFPRRALGELFAVLQAPTVEDEATLAPIPAPLQGEDERRFELVRERIAVAAAAASLPASLLAPRRQIEALVRGDPGAGLEGWRAALLGEALKPLVAAPIEP